MSLSLEREVNQSMAKQKRAEQSRAEQRKELLGIDIGLGILLEFNVLDVLLTLLDLTKKKEESLVIFSVNGSGSKGLQVAKVHVERKKKKVEADIIIDLVMRRSVVGYYLSFFISSYPKPSPKTQTRALAPTIVAIVPRICRVPKVYAADTQPASRTYP